MILGGITHLPNLRHKKTVEAGWSVEHNIHIHMLDTGVFLSLWVCLGINVVSIHFTKLIKSGVCIYVGFFPASLKLSSLAFFMFLNLLSLQHLRKLEITTVV